MNRSSCSGETRFQSCDGESGNPEKTAGAVLSSGSVVRQGEGNRVVMVTGARTYVGRTTELVQTARPKQLQRSYRDGKKWAKNAVFHARPPRVVHSSRQRRGA